MGSVCFFNRSRNAGRVLACLNGQGCRHVSSNQVSSALRPFYFAVHPDLFGQHPVERCVNENSLKVLNNHIETLMLTGAVPATRLKFYLRKNGVVGKFEPVHISLVGKKNVKDTLRSILSACKLPTDYVDALPAASTVPPKTGFKIQDQPSQGSGWTVEWPETFGQKTKEDVDDPTLSGWLRKNSLKATERLQLCRPVREEISRLKEELCLQLKLADLLWDCGWGMSHFRGCLQSFQSLVIHHREEMSTLQHRTVIFGRESGVSLQGHVILNSAEVRHNWLDMIRNLHRYQATLKRVPSLEAALSRTLCDISVSQRRFRPELLAEVYESNLIKLTTSLGDYRGRYGYPRSWPNKLTELNLVVEGESGPLMLSPSGDLITPSSCPASLLVSFITDHLREARVRKDLFDVALEEEKQLTDECVQRLGLSALGKDDNVTPSQMATSCRRLLEHRDSLQPLVQQSRLWMTHYYSLLSDGEMCIPWNWK